MHDEESDEAKTLYKFSSPKWGAPQATRIIIGL